MVREMMNDTGLKTDGPPLKARNNFGIQAIVVNFVTSREDENAQRCLTAEILYN